MASISKNIKILYRDQYITVAQKPAGLLSEESVEHSFPALLSAALCAAEGVAAAPLYTVHRLDKETEGIMLYARTSAAAAALSRQITEGSWQKIYTATLWGNPEKDEDTLCDLLYYDRARGKSYVVKKERKGVKSAILNYSVLSRSEDGKRTRVRVELGTGRTHQIRVQFASRGLPLCGDRRYGAPAESGSTLALCASALSFAHPKTGEILSFEIDCGE